ncbi:MAG: transcriptional regulator, propionate catabolism operon regulatory protein [Pseudomonadota bacterium]|nr:transcriptional regulator, propionate catabolism operon regulatory protein [Pseudomonadota bacterium]
MQKKPQLLVVASRGLAELVRSLLPEYAPRFDVRLLDKPLEEALSEASELQRSGLLDVLLAAGQTGMRLREALATPLVQIKVGGDDIMHALVRARHLSGKVAIVTRQDIGDEFDEVRPLLKLEVLQFKYRSDDEAHSLFQQLREQGVEVVIGSAQVAHMAEQEGLAGVLIYSERSLRQAFEDAWELARVARIEEAKRERIGNLLHSLAEGVLAVDMAGRIQTLNPAMERLLGVSVDWAVNQPIKQLAPELSLDSVLASGISALEQVQQVAGRTLVVNRMPIFEQGQQTGAVLTFQEASNIQRADRKLRYQSRASQFLARYRFDDILGESPAIADCRRLAQVFARTDSTVLISGESGTGKELFAQAIHNTSRRADGPFVAINCASFPETLLESELFGYEEGAFTGGRKGGKPGLIEAAHTGTLFLDEIGEMPVSLQTRLLRVLQEREVLRLGSTEPTPVSVRVIAATHRNLHALTESGEFRADLYYRLNILNLRLPPLRERQADIKPLVLACANRVVSQLSRTLDLHGFWQDCGIFLQKYHWPGNVRELENVIERLLVFNAEIGNLDQSCIAIMAPELFSSRQPEIPVLALADALAASKGNLGQAASLLGISRTTLWRRMKSTEGGKTGVIT